MMTKAVTLRRRSFREEADGFEKDAERYIKEEKEADDGPDVSPIQVADDTLMDTEGQWMT
jgi:hypothetical protein